MFKKIISLGFLLFFLVKINGQGFFNKHPEINPFQYDIIKSNYFSKAAVSSAHPLASLIGAAIMQDGGNAFDAAIAVQLALAVVHPSAGNIGGGGFLLAWQKGKKPWGLDYRETAPFFANEKMYLNDSGQVVREYCMQGAFSAGIPGTIAGLFETHKYAKLPFNQLLQPAIELAEKGFVITANLASDLNTERANFERASATKIFAFNTKNYWQKGDTLIQTDLANTLKRIQEYGAAGFYAGKTAELIVAEMNNSPIHKGIISLEDLKNYQVKYRSPLQFKYRGFNIISFAPPSSGGIIINQICNMLTPYSLEKIGSDSLLTIQLIIEAERRSFADRAQYLGDPDFIKIPVKTLVSKSYCLNRFKDFSINEASKSENIDAGTITESEETTHLSIVDNEGNIISVTTTLNNSYGSKAIVGYAGFLLNNEMDDFSAKPGEPNMYGAVGGVANKIEPNKRMLSSMTPTIVLKKNKPFLSIGTPGGTTIPTSVLQVLINVIDHKKNLLEAINNPRFHHQWLPDLVFVEEDFNNNTVNFLEKLGYKIKKRTSIGRTDGILFTNKGLEAVGDKRGDDSVAGY